MLLVRKTAAHGVNLDLRDIGAGVSTLGYSGESGLKGGKIFGKWNLEDEATIWLCESTEGNSKGATDKNESEARDGILVEAK